MTTQTRCSVAARTMDLVLLCKNSRIPQDARVVTLSVDGVLSPTSITDGGGSDSTEPLKIANIG